MPSPPEEPHDEQAAPAADGGSDEAQQVERPQDPSQALGAVAAPAEGVDAGREPAAEEAPSTEQPAPKRPDYKAVARISTQAVLQSIDLASLHAQLEDGVAVPSEWAMSARRSEDASANFDRDALTLVVHCAFDATWAPEPAGELAPDPADEAALQLHARFRLEYAINGLEGILDGDEEHFARTNGMLHAWPYWREAAQSMTVRMGVEPLVVGTFKIPWSGDPGREKKKAASPEDGPAGQVVPETTSVELQASGEGANDPDSADRSV